MDKKKTNGSDIGEWIFIVVMMGVFWPVGVYLLFRKLMGYGKKAQQSRERARSEYHYTASQLKNVQQGGRPAPADSAHAYRKNGRIMTGVGGAMAGIFSVAGISKFLDYLSWGGLKYAWSELFPLFGLFVAGLVVLYAGLFRTRKGKRFQKYLNTIGRQKQISVATLARTTGHRVSRVCDDLDEMLEKGFFPVGYLDRAAGVLYLTDEGAQEPVKEQPAPKTDEEEYAILKEIRAVNDAIPDELMSAKIDRIEVITKRILDYQKQNPGQDAELRSFLDYYLPTTLKILRSYAQLDAQGISGENINAAKARIEGMMDKVVEGFEKQLDRLFQSESLDITSDVEVLEQMLKKDGLSADAEGFQLKL